MYIIKMNESFKAYLIYIREHPYIKHVSYIYMKSHSICTSVSYVEYVLADILSDRTGQASVHFIDINVYVYLSVFKH